MSAQVDGGLPLPSMLEPTTALMRYRHRCMAALAPDCLVLVDRGVREVGRWAAVQAGRAPGISIGTRAA